MAFNFFGFRFGKDKPDTITKTFVPKQNNDAAIELQSYYLGDCDFYNRHVYDIKGGINKADENRLIETYREMSLTY